MNASHIYSTDTDSKDIPGFLLGVIVALSVLFVALEFTSVTTPDVPDDSFDDMVQDMDLQSYADQRDMISADRPAVAASANIKAVEAPQTATPDKLAAQAAAVMSCFPTPYVWLAIGIDHVTPSDLFSLKGRSVVVFPDKGERNKWEECLRQIPNCGTRCASSVLP